MAANKHAGKKSLAQNDFLQPQAPTGVSAANVGTNRPYNNGAATVSFSLPAGSPAATSYVVTSSPGNISGTGSSSPITVTGLASNTAYTFTVVASNGYGSSAASSASASITATTVPDAPTGVSATSPSGTSYDTVTWNAPANGGSAITNYYLTSSDGKTKNSATTSTNVDQEAGTAQTYTIYADNANGRSAASAESGSVTTFSFVPFSVFNFFGVFNFFAVFGFVAFYPNSFSPGSFYATWSDSIGIDTKVLTPLGFKLISDVEVGDVLVSAKIGDGQQVDPETWTSENLESFEVSETTVISKDVSVAEEFIYIDGDMFTKNHLILTKKDGVIKFTKAQEVDESFERYSPVSGEFTRVEIVETLATTMNKVSLRCEPYDNFFTERMLVFERGSIA